jgi:ribosomal-protein-alanine N-acetyltransferase
MRAVDEAHLLVIGVDRRHQGQGHGARLLQCAMRASGAVGVRRMLLEVRASNAHAIAFYEEFGFERIGLRRGYYPAAIGREDALVMAKELPWA